MDSIADADGVVFTAHPIYLSISIPLLAVVVLLSISKYIFIYIASAITITMQVMGIEGWSRCAHLTLFRTPLTRPQPFILYGVEGRGNKKILYILYPPSLFLAADPMQSECARERERVFGR